MELYFIRHAQSTNNALYERTGGVVGRQPDPDLTDLGHQQGQALAQFVARPHTVGDQWDPHNVHGFGLTHLYCSLMTRAIQTASYVAEAAELPLTAHPDIHEYSGIFRFNDDKEKIGLAGPKRIYFEERFPHVTLPDWPADEGWNNCRTETDMEMLPRARRAIDDLLARHGGSDDRVAIVSHGGFYQAFVAEIMGIPVKATTARSRFDRGFAVGNCAITRFHIEADFIGILYLNKVHFLPIELQS